ncbi:RIP metalloprotease RseP [Anaerostipes sp. 992a]|uniref:RIP metalloprotease RseP n=1 Tax=Anaerostipes sp. 992a TaxID=1261637 RepID=UPI000950FBB6|nr:RIP metalloprotease RseP [Anaerostipes sp. 992a]OLR62004.1 RIP metalloprotease RseP [Anaerostipes sp. 992a]
MKIIIAFFIFGAIILFHELGHFLLAKKNGIRVEEFCLGLGPTIIGKQIGETFYSLKLLPFGGACMMTGEDEESPDERAFGNKSVPARMSVVFAGPFFNFIMAFVLSLVLISLTGSDVPVLSRVEPNSPAYEAGLKKGDEITKIADSRVHNFREISYYLMLEGKGHSFDVEYKRDGEEYTTSVTPVYDKEIGSYRIGIQSSGYQKLNPLKTIQYSIYEVRCQIKVTVISLKQLIMGQFGLNDISGPVGIVSMIGDTYTQAQSYGWLVILESMLSLTILLSANLGVMNLLPIPALDGGRLVFLLIEGIRGKAMDPDKEGKIHYVGLMLLLAIMLLVMVKDIRTLFIRFL